MLSSRDGGPGFGKRPPSCFQEDEVAGEESIQSGIYVTWVPSVYANLTESASNDVRPGGTGQCCRVHIQSMCLCGHSLSNHKSIPVSTKAPPGAYIKPPGCRQCGHGHCSGFRYAPRHPAECGQFWLEGRKDFNIDQWRLRVQQYPHEYACIGCDTKVSEHETVFERECDRLHRGAPVGEMYRPLAEQPTLRQKVQRIRCRYKPLSVADG